MTRKEENEKGLLRTTLTYSSTPASSFFPTFFPRANQNFSEQKLLLVEERFEENTAGCPTALCLLYYKTRIKEKDSMAALRMQQSIDRYSHVLSIDSFCTSASIYWLRREIVLVYL